MAAKCPTRYLAVNLPCCASMSASRSWARKRRGPSDNYEIGTSLGLRREWVSSLGCKALPDRSLQFRQRLTELSLSARYKLGAPLKGPVLLMDARKRRRQFGADRFTTISDTVRLSEVVGIGTADCQADVAFWQITSSPSASGLSMKSRHRATTGALMRDVSRNHLGASPSPGGHERRQFLTGTR